MHDLSKRGAEVHRHNDALHPEYHGVQQEYRVTLVRVVRAGLVD